MNSEQAFKLLRFDRLERQAQAYREAGMRTGNRSRVNRAIRLEIAAHGRAMEIVMREVEPYSEYS